jgi:hypothetical protein
MAASLGMATLRDVATYSRDVRFVRSPGEVFVGEDDVCILNEGGIFGGARVARRKFHPRGAGGVQHKEGVDGEKLRQKERSFVTIVISIQISEG